MSKKRTVDINLGYYKQGDDLYNCLEECDNAVEAFRSHSVQMIAVSEHLNKIADMIEGHEVEVSADVHFINITCDEELAQKLIDAELADKDPMEDEMEDDDWEDDDDDDQEEDDDDDQEDDN